MTAYAEIRNGAVLQQIGTADPEGFMGPDDPTPTNNGGCTYRKLTAAVDWSVGGGSSTMVLVWPDTDVSPSWQETATLPELKASKNSEINQARLTANRSTFTYLTKEIACDELSRSDIDAVNGIVSLTGAMPPNWVGGWKTVDNSYVAIPDVAAWTQFFVAMVTKGSSNFDHAQSLKAQLAAATTPEDVSLIKWA